MKIISRLIDPAIRVRKIRIGQISALVLSPRQKPQNAPGVLWIHGGGYFLGMKEMVWMSRAVDLVKKFGAVVVAPGYRLAFRAPYPAALIDCYGAMRYMKIRADALGINEHQLMVGGESAGGGLTAAVCLYARDRGDIHVAYQMPLYPMLDCCDTETSRDNHQPVWNTRKNHHAWNLYLRGFGWKSGVTEENMPMQIPYYASPAREKDLAGMPPAYTFVGEDDPFLQETRDYVKRLNDAGIEAAVDVYPGCHHAFDLFHPMAETSRNAFEKFHQHFEYALEHYFAPNP